MTGQPFNSAEIVRTKYPQDATEIPYLPIKPLDHVIEKGDTQLTVSHLNALDLVTHAGWRIVEVVKSAK